MAKQTQTPAPAEAPPETQPEPKAPSYRVLVNPNGNFIKFRLDDPAYDYHLCLQRPPGVKPDKWFREPADAELAEFVKANPYK